MIWTATPISFHGLEIVCYQGKSVYDLWTGIVGLSRVPSGNSLIMEQHYTASCFANCQVIANSVIFYGKIAKEAEKQKGGSCDWNSNWNKLIHLKCVLSQICREQRPFTTHSQLPPGIPIPSILQLLRSNRIPATFDSISALSMKTLHLSLSQFTSWGTLYKNRIVSPRINNSGLHNFPPSVQFDFNRSDFSSKKQKPFSKPNLIEFPFQFLTPEEPKSLQNAIETGRSHRPDEPGPRIRFPQEVQRGTENVRGWNRILLGRTSRWVLWIIF